MYTSLRILASLAIAFILVSCADRGVLSPDDPSYAGGGNGHYLRDLDANAPIGPDTTVLVGDVLHVGLAAGNGNGPQNNKNVVWTTSNAAVVAVVPDRGRATLTAMAAGSAIVCAKLGGNTECVTITVVAANTPPVAVDDSYEAIGNVTLSIDAPGVLANDTDAESGVTAVPGTFSTTGGGMVTLSADGSFVYRGAAGFIGVDSFDYTVTDGTDSDVGTVTITLTERVWYVKNDATAPGDGRDASPFTTLAQAEAASIAGETIFVYAGDGSTAGQDQGITLKAGQELIGQGVSSDVTTTLNGETVVLLAAGSAPTITSASGATVQLATGNTLRGLRVESQSGAGIAGAGFGTFSASEASVAAVGGAALQLSTGQVVGTFSELSSLNGSNGLFLDNLLAGSSVTATGAGSTPGSGGTLESASGAGVLVDGPATLSLSNVRVRNNGGAGIDATGLVGFTLAGGEVTGNGGTGIDLDGVTGTAAITASTVTGAAGNNVAVSNAAGTLALNVAGSTFSNAAGGSTDGVGVSVSGGAAVNVSVQNSVFTSAAGELFQLAVGGAASSDLVLSNNAFSNNHPSIASGGGGVLVTAGAGGSPTLTYSITGNSFRDALGTALVVSKTSGTGTATGTISGNSIGVSGVANSGSAQGSGIDIGQVGGGTHTATITNNTIHQFTNFAGILTQSGNNSLANGGQGRLKLVVQGNTIAEPSPAAAAAFIATNGIHLQAGTNTGDNLLVCATIGGAGGLANTVTGTGINGGADIRMRALQATQIRLVGMATDPSVSANRTAFLQANNPGATVSTVTGGTGSYANGSCTF